MDEVNASPPSQVVNGRLTLTNMSLRRPRLEIASPEKKRCPSHGWGVEAQFRRAALQRDSALSAVVCRLAREPQSAPRRVREKAFSPAQNHGRPLPTFR